MSESSCTHDQQVIELYTALANNPARDFGWEKGRQNALNHGYNETWIAHLPAQLWDYCAAVGNPFTACAFRAGATVLDLGCGAGVDLCVAALLVGAQGTVIGVDITPAMVQLARLHAIQAKLENIIVHEASIEQLPLPDNSVDIIISNGAINLAGSKQKVFEEAWRILRPGGRLSIADMIRDEPCEQVHSCDNDSWADCVAGTLDKQELLDIMKTSGFHAPECVATTHYRTARTTVGATFRASKVTDTGNTVHAG
ncbi:MAG: methyltransferase domain-containing protein [Gammaproteobacteria bacterium]|nr:methyltransferase domain-containing protein [Gammaproteobacteria bacterium]MDH3561487.1 methyltransferase domain-containing protein [Gammaproteobacteria bacterium]